MVATALRDVYRVLVLGGWFVLQSTDFRSFSRRDESCAADNVDL